MRPTLYMMIGLPGSGKSTVIRRMTDKIGYPHAILSTDFYVEGYAKAQGKDYNEVFKEAMPFAELNLQADLANAIDKNIDIYWDQTNLSKKTRAKKLAKIPASYRKVAVVVSVSDETLQKQLDKRVADGGKYISPDVVQSMRNTYEEPSLDEGFDDIIRK